MREPELANTLGSPRGHDEQATYIVQPASPSVAASADSTTDSPAPDSATCSCANPTLGGGTCCGHGSQECRSQTTYETWPEVSDTMTSALDKGTPEPHMAMG